MTCCGVDLAFKASTPRDGSFPDLTATPIAHLMGSAEPANAMAGVSFT